MLLGWRLLASEQNTVFSGHVQRKVPEGKFSCFSRCQRPRLSVHFHTLDSGNFHQNKQEPWSCMVLFLYITTLCLQDIKMPQSCRVCQKVSGVSSLPKPVLLRQGHATMVHSRKPYLKYSQTVLWRKWRSRELVLLLKQRWLNCQNTKENSEETSRWQEVKYCSQDIVAFLCSWFWPWKPTGALF